MQLPMSARISSIVSFDSGKVCVISPNSDALKSSSTGFCFGIVGFSLCSKLFVIKELRFGSEGRRESFVASRIFKRLVFDSVVAIGFSIALFKAAKSGTNFSSLSGGISICGFDSQKIKKRNSN